MSGAVRGLLILLLALPTPPEPQDPEVLKAKVELEEGHRAAARESLERATARLKVTGPKTRELAVALYYGGVLEAGDGRAQAAQDRFREALAIDPGLPPPATGREAFDAAREQGKGGPGRPGVWKGAVAAGVVLGAGLVALAASGSSSGTSSPSLTTVAYTGEMGGGAAPVPFPLVITSTGIVTAVVRWIQGGPILTLELDDVNHQPLAVSVLNTPFQSTLTVVAAPGPHELLLIRRDALTEPADYTLTVTHP
jgi:hypothetical protein